MRTERKRIVFKGVVQGVGFRPFVYRTALAFQLTGFVRNTPGGVWVEVEGKRLDAFIKALQRDSPRVSRIHGMTVRRIQPEHSTVFEIKPSADDGKTGTLVSPDIAICPNCIREFSDPANRRYRYPFITCTDCGPRWTIIEKVPYDRPNTSMKIFPMCASCRKEYEDPADRRYHAQPISCFDCGPGLFLVDASGRRHPHPVENAVGRLKRGEILAVKGMGGYHLACAADDDAAVLRLRRLKKREKKPFALMGTREMIGRECRLTEAERALLESAAAPILLLRKRKDSTVSRFVAPGLNRVGFMIPYTPLHLLLVEGTGKPLVMTSANHSDEPILFTDDLGALAEVADAVLSHDRPIRAFADDSVAQREGGRTILIRRSRGFVPLPLQMPFRSPQTVLGLGGLLKGTFAFLKEDRALISPYIGTLDSPRSLDAEKYLIDHFMDLFALSPDVVAIDMHPLYPNRRLGDRFTHSRIREVQHHRAHVAALLAERKIPDRIIGMAMDGTGYGDDGKIWGGEFFVGDIRRLDREGHLQYVFLPSGDLAIREPWRFSLSILHAIFGAGGKTAAFAEKFGKKGRVLLEAISRQAGGVYTSSCGRVFDGVASLLGLGDTSGYDGELPALLQALAEASARPSGYYPFSVGREDGRLVLNLLPAIAGLIDDSRGPAEKAWMFHRTLARGFREVAERLRERHGIGVVGLTGGVFQNMLLLKMTVRDLRAGGFRVLTHSRLPANDGSLSLGQACLACREEPAGCK